MNQSVLHGSCHSWVLNVLLTCFPLKSEVMQAHPGGAQNGELGPRWLTLDTDILANVISFAFFWSNLDISAQSIILNGGCSSSLGQVFFWSFFFGVGDVFFIF